MRALIVVLLLTFGSSIACADAGRFVVKPPQVTSSEWRDEARAMQDSGTLQELAAALNSIFVLPRDINMRYVECGEANAYYDAEAHEIQMCLELMQEIAELLAKHYEDEDVADAAAGAYIATALHEAGHALVHVLELPVTGREEDAVDQLSAWMLIEADDVDSVLGVAAMYYTDAEVGDEELGNEHSLDKQRYYNLVCWAYGSDPDNSQELIDTWELPQARAELCVDEYKQLDRSWTRLLRDHLREDSATVFTVPRAQTPSPRQPHIQTPATPRSERWILGRISEGPVSMRQQRAPKQRPGKD